MKRWTAVFLALMMLLPAACGAEDGTVYKLANSNERLYDLGDTGWVVEQPRYMDSYPASTKDLAVYYCGIAEKNGLEPPYVYLINSSKSIDFDHPEETPRIWTTLQECFPDSRLGYLEIRSIEDFCNYFYKTDHHWNYKGSYQGYKDIIRLILGEDEPLMEPLETVQFPFTFNGSYNKRLGRENCDELFTVYRFDYPEMELWINLGRKKDYGRAKVYFDGSMDASYSFTNHYGEFYGSNRALIQFGTNRPEKESLLIFCNSYACANCMLIATHFNNTLLVDMREFDDVLGGKTTIDQLISRYGVTKILLMGDASFFRWW